ncbi:MAG: three-Cys-motif partner protein TcmP [Syntrophales bacterium]|jgi:three-Cys-motif partner protein|nr:three-Cys-motif partner protein TcmP [Syntrophales bacterium]
MPRRDLHQKPYDEGTQDKLDLYREYLREWLPVFINLPSVETLQIFDFFAGPGNDTEGNPGSPLITCEEIRKALNHHGNRTKKIRAYFNECAADKYQDLSSCIDEQRIALPQVEFTIKQSDFHSVFEQWEPLMRGKTANLLFLDQNGVQQITEDIFKTIVRLSLTDVIFFISSGMVNRFKNIQEIRKYVPVTDADFVPMNGKNVHRIVADAYRRWIPEGHTYYRGSFSIQKGPNVYGLVFGSHHPRGIDKFLHIAWRKGGDANFDIDNDGIDPNAPSLFSEYDKPTKITVFEKDLEIEVLEHRILTNKEVYIFSLQCGVLGSHAKAAMNKMVKEEKLPHQVFRISYGAWTKPNAEPIKHF